MSIIMVNITPTILIIIMQVSGAFKLGRSLMQMRYQAFLNYSHFQKPLRFDENTKIKKIMNMKFLDALASLRPLLESD